MIFLLLVYCAGWGLSVGLDALMLDHIKLENFRGFERHTLPLAPLTVIVGQNNAGKSTIVEALRLLSLAITRCTRLSYGTPPAWTGRPKREYGISPSLRNVEIEFSTLTHQYADPPSTATVVFSSGVSVTAYIDDARLFAVIRDPAGQIVKTAGAARGLNIPQVAIMPQIGPVQRKESILRADYIRAALDSPLASLHFRNQLNVFYKQFRDFKRVVEETWPGVQVQRLDGRGGIPGDSLRLWVRNGGFVGEAGVMGHGLQMWLQTMWFLTRARGAGTVILDEPDVYMHPDLQRRLIRFLRGRFPQIVMTSHSVELVSEVEPDDLLVVDKERPSSSFASSLPAVQRIVERVGSTHNVHLARLWRARRFLMLEGKDIDILTRFHETLFPVAESMRSVPRMSIGGWGGWKLAIGSSMALNNAFGEAIVTYCILDSDYHVLEEQQERLNEARQRGVCLHIWNRKEIENYLLVPSAIARYIAKHARDTQRAPDEDAVRAKLLQLAEEKKEEVFDAIASEIQARNRKWLAGRVNQEARRRLSTLTAQSGGILTAMPGKALLSGLSQWSGDDFGVGLSHSGIAAEMTASEIDAEVKHVLESIERGVVFPEGT